MTIGRLRAMKHPRAHESAANPDFQVTSATRGERELRRMLTQLNAKSESIDRRMSALDRIAQDKVRTKQEAEDSEVIDEGDVAEIKQEVAPDGE